MHEALDPGAPFGRRGGGVLTPFCRGLPCRCPPLREHVIGEVQKSKAKYTKLAEKAAVLQNQLLQAPDDQSGRSRRAAQHSMKEMQGAAQVHQVHARAPFLVAALEPPYSSTAPYAHAQHCTMVHGMQPGGGGFSSEGGGGSIEPQKSGRGGG